MDAIHEDHRIHRVQGAVLPLGHPLQHLVRDRGDRRRRHVRAVDLGQVRADVTVRQSAGGQREHHVLHAAQPPRPLLHDARLERPGAVARHLDRHRPGLGQDRLRAGAVTAVAVGRATSLVRLVAQVVGNLPFQGGLQHQLRQLAQQPVLPGQIQPLLPGPGDQLRHQRPIHRRHPAEPLLGVLHLLPSQAHGPLNLRVLRRHHVITSSIGHTSQFGSYTEKTYSPPAGKRTAKSVSSTSWPVSMRIAEGP